MSHIATDRILPVDGRFRGTADMAWRDAGWCRSRMTQCGHDDCQCGREPFHLHFLLRTSRFCSQIIPTTAGREHASRPQVDVLPAPFSAVRRRESIVCVEEFLLIPFLKVVLFCSAPRGRGQLRFLRELPGVAGRCATLHIEQPRANGFNPVPG